MFLPPPSLYLPLPPFLPPSLPPSLPLSYTLSSFLSLPPPSFPPSLPPSLPPSYTLSSLLSLPPSYTLSLSLSFSLSLSLPLSLPPSLLHFLLSPLPPQVSNLVGGLDLYQQRVQAQLCPCLTQLAVAAGKEALWKPLNHQLLLKTRHSNAHVRLERPLPRSMCSIMHDTFHSKCQLLIDKRFTQYHCARFNTHVHAPTPTPTQVRYAVVLVLKGLYSQLGEEFMTLLPETIPFLAELLEGMGHNLHPYHFTHSHSNTLFFTSAFDTSPISLLSFLPLPPSRPLSPF